MGEEKDPKGTDDRPEIGIEDFQKLDLRIAQVVRAEAHPNADRLLRLQIDIGGEERQIVAGIASAYRPDELVGLRIAVVTNLKPVKLRGEWSQGMLLAASDAETLALLSPTRDVPPGSRIS
jgi:methionyl-tRNA synthetase